jgi:hypothetical protein
LDLAVVVVVVSVTMSVVMIMIVTIFVVAVIAVVVMVPIVIVFDSAMISVPVTGVVAMAVVARSDPTGASVRRPAPVAFVPVIMSGFGIPIAANPDEFRSRLSRHHGYRARRRRSANRNADGNLSTGSIRSAQQKSQQ